MVFRFSPSELRFSSTHYLHVITATRRSRCVSILTDALRTRYSSLFKQTAGARASTREDTLQVYGAKAVYLVDWSS